MRLSVVECARGCGRPSTAPSASAITVGVGLLSWVFLIGPNVRAPDLLLSQRLVSIAYPLCDVLVAVAVRRWRTGGHGTAASRLLTVGLVALLAPCTRRWSRSASRPRRAPA